MLSVDHIIGTKGHGPSHLPIEVIDLQGTTLNLNGDYLLLNEVQFQNGTVNVNPGSTLYVWGYEYNHEFYPHIRVSNASLNVTNATIKAACDTMWGGISSIESNPMSFINIRGVNGSYSTISDAFEYALQYQDGGLATIGNKYYTIVSVNHAKFLNNKNNIYTDRTQEAFYYPDTISNCIFDADSATMHYPLKHQYANTGVTISNFLGFTAFQNNTFKHMNIAVSAENMTSATISGCTFTDNYGANIYLQYFYSSGRPIPPQPTASINLTGNTFNLPISYPAYLGTMVGKSTALYLGVNSSFYNYGGNVSASVTGNIFNGSTATGITHVAFANSINTSDGYNLTGNTFNGLSSGINNLNFMSRISVAEQNTFTGCTNPIFVDKNSLELPHCSIHCNTFDRGSLNNVSAINVGTNGILSDTIGRCKLGQAAGNKFTNYTGINFTINNQNSPQVLNYNRSINEALGNNPGPANSNGVGFLCGLTASGCPTGGPGAPFILGPLPPLPPLIPTLQEVQVTITQLVNNLILPTQSLSAMIGQVIDYYTKKCGPEYQNVVNNMLPNNLTAYNALAWNLTDCYIGQGNPVGAINLMNQINYNNPGNVEVQQRTNFYTVMMRLSGLTTSIGYKATAPDIDVLANVAASGTQFSAAACYTLLPIAPQRTAGCFTLPTNNTHRIGDDNVVADNNNIAFSNIPNPFSESTKVNYVLPANTQQAVLNVYNVQGKLVKAIPLNMQDNESVINANDMINGIYLYSITADGVTAAPKRMVVIK